MGRLGCLKIKMIYEKVDENNEVNIPTLYQLNTLNSHFLYIIYWFHFDSASDFGIGYEAR